MQENEQQVHIDFQREFDAFINADGKITPNLLMAVNRYFLYFSFFESLLLDCAGSQRKSEAYARKIIELNLEDIEVVRCSYNFFAERYTSAVHKFYSLCGEGRHTAPEVRDKYLGYMAESKIDTERQLELCLFVCFRLRNNLFHGPKWRYYLEGQEELLLVAGNLIHSIISLARKREPDGWRFVNMLSI